jgi:catechol 2,3-dioxygenase-like lactoylglutathione lyase family enzyme
LLLGDCDFADRLTNSSQHEPQCQERRVIMAVRLNHTIVAAHDHEASSKFLAEVLGLPPPLRLGPFAIVTVGDTSLDYMNVKEYRGDDGEIVSQHYAFLVTEIEFDEIFARIRERHLPYWADPRLGQQDQINEWDGGRGVYFQDPNGHILEAITRPYGSGGTRAARPHPLLAASGNRAPENRHHDSDRQK